MKKLKNIHIIGGGMGEASLLTSQAMEVFKNCEKVFAFDRMASLLEKYRQVEKCSYNQLVTLINNCDESEIGVVVSGDVGFFSIASTLNNALKEKFNVNFLCGISSLQYLCSKVKIPYENVNVVSVHGRSGSILGSIAYNKYTFVLTGGENNASVILKFLSNKIPKIKVIAAQHLSSDEEKIEMGTVEELSQKEYSSLTVLLFENNNFHIKEKALFDKDFKREKVPMTKQEVRWVTLGYMDIQPNDVVYDIGTGTGAMTIEMAKRCYDGEVYGVEINEEAYLLTKKNVEELGIFNAILHFGEASCTIESFPKPDKVFIGGSKNNLKNIVSIVLDKNPNVKITVNAISLETLTETISLFKELDFKYTVSCINSANSKLLGDYNLMMANNPVYIISTF